MTISTLQPGQAELPSANSTDSYWHKEPSRRLLGHRSTAEIPASADVVVIGSGITGAFAARELAAGGRSVVMLEAREACWGATGRNGGHCQPFIYSNKPHIARFELATYHFLRDLVATHNIPCDWRTVGGVHALATDELATLVRANLDRLRRIAPDLAEKATLVTDPEALIKLRLLHAKAAVVQTHAARCWPYKLVCWVLETLLDEYPALFNLQTKTPATALQRFGSSWIVHTPRGQVAASDVLIATNGYASHLLPRLADVIVPVRGQVAALRPPHGADLLEHTHGWSTSPDDSEDYLIQREAQGTEGNIDEDTSAPTAPPSPLLLQKGEMVRRRAPGPLILGGERLASPDGGVGISHDDELDPAVSRKLHQALHEALKLKPSAAPEDPVLTPSHEWTGIMGYSADQHPWVGRVPESLGGEPGLWMSAGYTGHGMPVAARCAVKVARMVLAGGGVQAVREQRGDLPKEFDATDERVEAVRESLKMGRVPRNLHESLVVQLRAALEEGDNFTNS